MSFHRNYLVTHFKQQRRFVSATTKIITKGDLPLSSAYKPETVEKDKYNEWEKQGRFTAENCSENANYSMVLPPPNVTGKLHLGHALACTVQDVIARRQRSLGNNVMWLPGTDHAGIATQNVVEKYIKNLQNKDRHDIGREKFVHEVWKWKEKYGDSICQQLRTLGCSLDWSRQVFTMDPTHTEAVNKAFIKLFNKGLIYRKMALVNWCHALKSTISDIEVNHIPINEPIELRLPSFDKPVMFGMMYEFAYRVYDSNEEIIVSTTMPETMLGDTAVAIHPHDVRYKHLAGKRLVHPFYNKTIPIIFDEAVDMIFGTGAVKITPAHSKIDYEISLRHNLPLHQVINEDGLIINFDKFNGLNKYNCRQQLIVKLEEIGLLKRVYPHSMTLPVCSRTGDVIDYLPKEQWFMSCSELNKKATEIVCNGELKIIPEKYVNIWQNWTKEDRDWCISRQLWWGHQIPAYKCSADKNFVWVAANDAKSAKELASQLLETSPEVITIQRDTDVLDTWFSSGIYPFASLGWLNEENSQDFKDFYPLSLMATGHDILGFWVHRMVILGLELTGKVPFKKVLLHGIICDNKGAKMSKSKGNVIDPIDVINGISMKGLKTKSEEMFRTGVLSKEELDKALVYHKTNFSNTEGIPDCGVDALRFTLLSQDIKSHYINFDVAMCHANKLFGNKIWQSIKYTQLAFSKLNHTFKDLTTDDLNCFDKWILSRLYNMIGIVNEAMDEYDFHLATKALKTFIHNEFCDFYLESTKPGFDSDNVRTAYAHAHTLSAVLHTSLRCLSPFMIYLTEELIPRIPSFEENLIINYKDLNEKCYLFPVPEDLEQWGDDETEERVDKLINCITLIRGIKGIYNISNKLKPTVRIQTDNKCLLDDIESNKFVLLNLTRCQEVLFEKDETKKHVSAFLDKNTRVEVEMLGDDIEKNIESARSRIEKRLRKLHESLARMEAKLSSTNYIENVPEFVRLSEIEKLETKRKQIQELQRLI